jgi:hypothetical protein
MKLVDQMVIGQGQDVVILYHDSWLGPVAAVCVNFISCRASSAHYYSQHNATVHDFFAMRSASKLLP